MEYDENKMVLTENQIINEIYKLLHDIDADGLADIAGYVFGGKCFAEIEYDEESKTFGDMVYNFYPNKFYGGAFGEREIEIEEVEED